MTDTGEPEANADAPPMTATERQLRGSTVLFGGRILALVLGLATQVLVVRGLAKTEYGAFAYALAIATAARVVVSFGEDQALTRFVAIYDRRREYGKLFGTYVLATTKIVLTSGLLIGGLFLLRGPIDHIVPGDEGAMAVLLVLVFLAPVDALDRMLEGSFAVFSRPRAIFFRKYLMEPGVRLAAVGLVVALGHGAISLAVAYVVGSLLGMAVYAWSLVGELRRSGLLAHRHDQRLVLPIREYFGFSFPLVTTEIVTLSLNTVSVVLLGRYGGVTDVADFRAILPAARVNQLVIFTFSMLFTPMAARFFADNDLAGMEHAYWQTAAWLALLSFPVFAVTGPLAEPVTVLMFGDRYRDAAPYLAILALGYYGNAALGFNALTLQTFGRIRWVVVVNLLAAAANVILGVVLIPRIGGIGAASSIAGALLLQNAANQWGLRRSLGIQSFEPRMTLLYGSVVAAGLALAGLQSTVDPPWPVGLAAAAGLSAGLLLLHRRRLRMAETFPELARLPLVGRLVG